MTPSIALTSFGIDSNVFRHEQDPKSDFTSTFSPGSRAWLRAGRTLLALDGRSDLVYFRRYSGEGSLDGVIGGRYEIRVNRLTPWIAARVTSGRQRIGYEIDARSRHGEREKGAGLDVQLLSRTRFTVSAQRVDYWYDADARFLGASLHEALNRRSASLGIGVSHRVTPLTTLVVQADAIRDRFTFSPARDSDSTRLLAGVDFAPLALISGSIRAGYRQFEAPEHGSDFRGLVGSFDAAYTLLGRTRFAIVGQRELNYSYDLSYPYYVLTGAHLTVTPRLSSHWDVQGRFGGQQLTYRDGRTAAARVDHLSLYGAGIGYRVGGSLRVGVNVDRERRTSDTHGRGFDGYRTGISMTYGR